MNVSVAMAAYKGEPYISEQIESIICQLRENDELIISINPSLDKTEKIAKEYALLDRRIRVTTNMKMGVLANVESAISQCGKDVIMLADQDDIWKNNKLKKQLEHFNDSNVIGVCHACEYIDELGNLAEQQPRVQRSRDIHIMEILIKNPVQGSCLAFRRELIDKILPFPKGIPMHDSWIGLVACRYGRLMYVNDSLLLYRQHSSSVTNRQHQPISLMIRDRYYLAASAIKYILKSRAR